MVYCCVGGVQINYIIYKLTNENNGKFYIGITSKTLRERWRGHCKKSDFGSTTNLHQSIAKHGKDCWKKEVLHKFYETSKKKAYAIEQEFIDKYNAYKNGYNMDMYGWNIVDRRGKNNPMYGKISGNAKKVVVNNVEYNSITEAATLLNKNWNTIWRWCKSDRYPDCYYV